MNCTCILHQFRHKKNIDIDMENFRTLWPFWKFFFEDSAKKKFLYILLTANFGSLQGSLAKRRDRRQDGETGVHTSLCCSRPRPPGSESTRHRAGRPGTDAAGQKRARTPSLPGLVWQPPAAVLSSLSYFFTALSRTHSVAGPTLPKSKKRNIYIVLHF